MKYLLYKVKDDGSKEKIYEVLDNKTEPFKLLRGILTLDEVKKNLFGENFKEIIVKDSGISTISTNSEGLTSSKNLTPDSVVYTGTSSCIIGNIEPIDDKTKKLIYSLNDSKELEADFKLLLIGYNEGFILKTGKVISNFFAGCEDGYLSKITKKNITSTGRRNAKIFSLKSMLKYIKEHKNTFIYCVNEYGYKWEIDFADKTFEKLFKDMKNKKEECILEEVRKELDLINNINLENDSAILEGMATDEEMREEAVLRMKKMNILNTTIKDFQDNNRIWKSEGPGVLYYLPQGDEISMQAISAANNNDYLVYHVIKTPLDETTMYAVLGVSRDKSAWEKERYEYKTNILDTYVYNPDFGLEYGSIKVLPSSGGLRRIG